MGKLSTYMTLQCQISYFFLNYINDASNWKYLPDSKYNVIHIFKNFRVIILIQNIFRYIHFISF